MVEYRDFRKTESERVNEQHDSAHEVKHGYKSISLKNEVGTSGILIELNDLYGHKE